MLGDIIDKWIVSMAALITISWYPIPVLSFLLLKDA
jgi:hypothetical protein